MNAVARNTALLSGGLACLFGMSQLTAAVATVTFVAVTHVESLLGLGPAIVLASNAAAAIAAGRAMDRVGRVKVIAAGFVCGGLGTAVTGLGALTQSVALVLLGFVLVGAANGTIQLSRAAAGEMYPPERRARGISRVLFGALAGALLGPFVFSPLLAGRRLDAHDMAVPWLAAGGFMALGLLLVLQVRPDPLVLARRYPPAVPTGPAAPLRDLLRRPGVVPAQLAAIASFAVMVSVMNLTGYVVLRHGHPHSAVFTVISAHFVGMFGLVLVVGRLVDRLGRLPALVGGLALVAASTLALPWVTTVAATAAAMFVLGLGWNLSYVAATAQLVDLAAPAERGRLLGFTDMCAAGTGAALALGGGVALGESGVPALAIVTTAVAAVPALLLAARRFRYNAAPAGT